MKLVILIVTALIPFATNASGQAGLPRQLCDRVKEIKQLPHSSGEKGVDATYDEIITAGDAVVPCLIDNVTNETIMNDPRCPTISKATTIGDVSYFLLIELLELNFTELLPADTQASYKTNGVYAYHDYIDRKGSRKELQANLRKWYSKHKGKQR
jgi:hypothetical protein